MAVDGVTVAALDVTNFHILDNAGTGSDIYFVTRPAGINGMPGRPSFATLQLHWYDYEAKVSLFDEPKHELIDGHFNMSDRPVCVATRSGYQLQGCHS
jgi:hypothetical protein